MGRTQSWGRHHLFRVGCHQKPKTLHPCPPGVAGPGAGTPSTGMLLGREQFQEHSNIRCFSLYHSGSNQ